MSREPSSTGWTGRPGRFAYSARAPEATIIWTRGAQDPNLGPDIRRWFEQAGFEELSCEEWIEGTSMRVGVNRLVAPPQPLHPGELIFTFYR